jgi:hypothetical protein
MFPIRTFPKQESSTGFRLHRFHFNVQRYDLDAARVTPLSARTLHLTLHLRPPEFPALAPFAARCASLSSTVRRARIPGFTSLPPRVTQCSRDYCTNPTNPAGQFIKGSARQILGTTYLRSRQLVAGHPPSSLPPNPQFHIDALPMRRYSRTSTEPTLFCTPSCTATTNRYLTFSSVRHLG